MYAIPTKPGLSRQGSTGGAVLCYIYSTLANKLIAYGEAEYMERGFVTQQTRYNCMLQHDSIVHSEYVWETELNGFIIMDNRVDMFHSSVTILYQPGRVMHYYKCFDPNPESW